MAECLKESGRSGGYGRKRFRDALVVAEVALATALMIGAGLLFTSFLRLRGINPGMPADRILTFSVEMKGAKYANLPAQAAFFRDVLREMRAIPGVESATLATNGAISGDWTDGRTYEAEWSAVDPDYFRMMGIPLLRGRNFADSDSPAVPPVAIVSQSFARQYCPNGDCQGVRFPLPRVGPAEIVGVVADRPIWGDREPRPAAYTHYQQADAPFATEPPPPRGRQSEPPDSRRPPAARRGRPLASPEPLPDARGTDGRDRRAAPRADDPARRLRDPRDAAGAAGIYGVMSHAVARRTHEIGVRVALGAARADIRTLVLGRGLLLISLARQSGSPGRSR